VGWGRGLGRGISRRLAALMGDGVAGGVLVLVVVLCVGGPVLWRFGLLECENILVHATLVCEVSMPSWGWL
jgi:hypothetical protein